MVDWWCGSGLRSGPPVTPGPRSDPLCAGPHLDALGEGPKQLGHERVCPLLGQREGRLAALDGVRQVDEQGGHAGGVVLQAVRVAVVVLAQAVAENLEAGGGRGESR